MFLFIFFYFFFKTANLELSLRSLFSLQYTCLAGNALFRIRIHMLPYSINMYIYKYIYIYLYVCMYVCVCAVSTHTFVVQI